MSASALLAAALDYAARGWPVFPVYEMVETGCSCGHADCDKNAGKHPRTEHGFKDATTNPATIREWWRRWPVANIGIVTGAPSGLLVLDGDPRNGGIESLKQIESKLPRTTLTAETGSGGNHWYFHLEGAAGCRTSFLPGLDIKADGGYVVAPPSRTRGPYSWMNAAEPAPAPDFLISRNGNGHHPERMDSAAVLAGVPEGERDATLFRFACKLRRADIPQNVAQELVLKAAGECDPPFPPEKARKKVTRAYSKYDPEPAGAELAPASGVRKEPDDPPVAAQTKKTSKRTLAAPLDIRATLTAPEEPIPWVVAPYFARGETVLIAGESGIGKSLALLDLALAMTAGHNFMTELPVTGGPYTVVMLDMENPHRLIRRRLRRMIYALDIDEDKAASLPLFYIRQPTLDLNDPEDFEALLAVVETRRPDFVFIDSLVRVHRGDENSNSEMRDLFAKLQLLPTMYDCGLVIAHHLAKPSKDRPADETRYRIRGATDILNVVDAALGLQRDANGFILVHEKTRWDAPGTDMAVTIEDVDEGLGVRLVAKEKTAVVGGVIDELLHAAQAAGARRPDIVHGAVEAGLTVTQASKAVSRELARRHGRGLVKKRGNQRTMVYWLTRYAPGDAE